MRRLRDIRLLDAHRQDTIGETEYLRSAVAQARIQVHLLRQETLTLRLLEPARDSSISPRYTQLMLERRIVRLLFDDGSLEEYRIESRQRSYTETQGSTFACKHLWHDLAKSAVYRLLPGSGDVSYDFSIVAYTAQEALSMIMATAPEPWVAGTTSGLRTDQQSRRLAIPITNGQTHLGAIRALCDQLSCEWYRTYDPNRDEWQIHLTEQVGFAGNRILRGEGSGQGATNRLANSRISDAQRYFSRLVPLLGQSGELVDVGQATFNVLQQGSTITLEEAAIPYDKFCKGLYFGSDAGGFHEITGAAAPNQIALASPFNETRGRFALDSSGTELTFLPDLEAEATFGVAYRSEPMQGTPFSNLLRDAGISDDFSEFVGSLPVGWTVQADPDGGEPTVEQIADPVRTRYGTGTAKVTAGPRQGIISDPVEVDEAEYLSMWLAVSTSSGTVGFSMVDAEGVEHPISGPGHSTNSRTLRALAAGAFEDFTGPVQVRIVALEAGTVFFADAVTLTPTGTQGVEWQPVMGPTDAWLRGIDILRKEGGTSFEFLRTDLIDLSVLFPEAYVEMEAGALIRVNENWSADTGSWELDYETRIMLLERDYAGIDQDVFVKVQLDEVRTDLVDALAAKGGDRAPLPPTPSAEAMAPVLSVQQTPSDTETVFELTPIASRETGTPLRSYELFLDHQLVGGQWQWLRTVVGFEQEFKQWEDSEDAPIPHLLPVQRPHPLRPAKVIRAYVVDRITGLRSATVDLITEPAPFRVTHAVDEPSDTVGTLVVSVYDPSGAMGDGGAIETQLKYPDAGAFEAWQPEPDSPAAGETGTFGTHIDLVRVRTFNLAPKPHNVLLNLRVRLQDAEGTPVDVYTASETYDPDKIPDLIGPLFSIGAYDPGLNRYEVLFSGKCDTDGRAFKTGNQSASFPSDVSTISDGFFSNLISKRDVSGEVVGYLDPGQTRHYAVIATENVNGTGLRTEYPYTQKVTAPDVVSAIPDASIIGDKLREGARKFIADPFAFSASDYRTVTWVSHTQRLLNGDQYTISSGTTGAITGTAGIAFVYWDRNNPTVYQTTTLFSNAISDDRLLMCVCYRAPTTVQKCGFVPAVGVLGINETSIGDNSISTGKIQAVAITADKIAVGAVTAAKINVVDLAAVAVSTGALTVTGDITDNPAEPAYKVAPGGIKLLSYSVAKAAANIQFIRASDSVTLGQISHVLNEFRFLTIQNLLLNANGTINVTSDTGDVHLRPASAKNLLFHNLPTSLPSGSDKVWNDGGFLRIS